MSRYQKSECKRNMLHDFRVIPFDKGGLLERCTRCGKKMHFPETTPNHVYLSFHIRQALPANDPRYKIEYPHAK